MVDLASASKNSEWQEANSLLNKEFKNAQNLADALKKIKNNGIELSWASKLGQSCFDFLNKTGKWEGLSFNDLDGIIGVLEQVSLEKPEDNKSKDSEIVSEKIIENDKIDLENGKVDVSKIRELVDDYEDYLKSSKNKQEALNKLIANYKDKLSPKLVEEFVKRQEEIYQKNLTKLKTNEKEPIVDVERKAKIITKEQLVVETEVYKELSVKTADQKKDIKIDNKIREIAQKTGENIIEKVINKQNKSNSFVSEPSTLEKYWEPKVEVIKTKIEVNSQVEKEVNNLIENLKDKVNETTLRISSDEIKTNVKEYINKNISGELMVENKVYADGLSQEIKRVLNKNGPGIDSTTAILVDTEVKIITTKVNNYIETNPEPIRLLKRDALIERISVSFDNSEIPLTANQMEAVREYKNLITDFYYPEGENLDKFKEESFEYAKSAITKIEGVNENSWTETKGLIRVIKMKPKEFNSFLEKYNQTTNKLNQAGLPLNIKECAGVDKLLNLINKNPRIKSLINAAQRVNIFYERLNSLTFNLQNRLGLKVGQALIGKIGNQAVKAFAQNALTIISQNGLNQGIGLILKQLVSRGVIKASAGMAAATVGAAAIPGIGWLIAGALLVYDHVLKPLFKKAGEILEKLGLGFGISKFLRNNFGKLGELGGKLIEAGLGLGILAAGALVAIPTMVIGSISTVLIGPVVIAVLVGMMGFQLFQGGLVSSLVPPKGMGSISEDEMVVTRDPNMIVPEGCPGGWPVDSGVITQGPRANYSHKTVEAIDIAENAIPIYATHPGQAIPRRAMASNNKIGYSVTIHGICEGKEFSTLYAHLPNNFLTKATLVQKGDIIGYVDNSGNSSGSHLHYQLNGLGSINNYLPKTIPNGYRNSQSRLVITLP